MRRLILVFVLIAAIITGGYALFFGQKPKQEMVPVLFATADMASGRFIPVERIEVRQIPLQEQKELSRKFGGLVSFGLYKELQNFVPRSPIKRGDAVTEKNLIRPSDPDFLPAVLNHGQRAVTVRLNDVASGVGLYRPGNYVDIILTYVDSSLKTSQKRVAVTLFRGLRILALGGDLGLSKVSSSGDAKADKKINSVVTLEASPRQAEEIVLASKLGDLSLSLRATEGLDEVSVPTSTFAVDLMKKGDQPATENASKRHEPVTPVKIRGLYGDQQKTITLE